jgi:excisionase family DNA binding protein
MIETLLSPKEVAKRIGVARSTLDRWTANGKFPPAIAIGPGRLAYRVIDVDAWLAGRRRNGGYNG